MKKFLCLLLCLITVCAFVGCGNETPKMSVDIPAPWQTSAGVTPYEKSVYAIEKLDKQLDKVIATGTVSYVIDFDHKVDDLVYASLTADMSITYNENAPEADRGLTDTVSSKTVFLSTALMPLSSVKTVTLAPRAGEQVNLSYELNTDYEAKTSTLKLNGEEETLDFSSKNIFNVYDNEMILFVARAYSELTTLDSYVTFNLANFFDMGVAGEYSVTPIKIIPTSTENNEETIYLDCLKNNFGHNEEGACTGVKTSLSINNTLTGPPIDALYAKNPFTVGENLTTKKVLLRYKTYEYAITNSDLKYETTYTLSDYTVTK